MQKKDNTGVIILSLAAVGALVYTYMSMQKPIIRTRIIIPTQPPVQPNTDNE